MIDSTLPLEFFDQLRKILEVIFIRLAQNGLDMYLLIFNSFIGVSYDLFLSSELIIYILKNSVNLLLPGTIFPEAYAPSGQFFIEIINRDFIGWQSGLDSFELYTTLNTSAYTLFGEAIIFFGNFAPFLIFIVIYFYSKLYYSISNIFIKSILAFCFLQALGSYGIDGTIGDSFNVLVSIFIIYCLLLFLSTFKLTPYYHSNTR